MIGGPSRRVFTGRMFRDPSVDFYAYGVGAMFWSEHDGHRVLWLLAPETDGRYSPARIFVMHEAKNWAKPGNVSGWDGNLERPTFKPSIWLHDKKGWHGYIRNGDLVTA